MKAGVIKTHRIVQYIFLLLLVLYSSGCTVSRESSWTIAGAVKIISGSMLISDPSYLPEILEDLTVQVDGIPPGEYQIEVLESNLENFGTRVVRTRIAFLPVTTNKRKQLGSVGVDSASLIAVDPSQISTEWVLVGPRRDGYIIGVERDQIAALLEKEGFRIGERSGWTIMLADPVSENDERRIEELIDSSGLRGFLFIETGNSYDHVAAMLEDSNWGVLLFNDGTPGLAVAFSTGIGDGYYPVFGLYEDNNLVGIEIEFAE